jgi:hypothetical protein
MRQKGKEDQQRYEKIGKNYTGFKPVFIETRFHWLRVAQSRLFSNGFGRSITPGTILNIAEKIVAVHMAQFQFIPPGNPAMDKIDLPVVYIVSARQQRQTN